MKISKIWFDNNRIYGLTDDGRTLWQSLLYYRRLQHATPEQREEVRELAVRSFKALGCNGVARIDFMIDEDTGKLYFNEINTIPGSLAFYLWEPIGIPYKELLDRMIQLAFKRQRTETALTFTFDTNILNSASFGGSKGGAKL